MPIMTYMSEMTYIIPIKQLTTRGLGYIEDKLSKEGLQEEAGVLSFVSSPPLFLDKG
jgi:hypothetical protein